MSDEAEKEEERMLLSLTQCAERKGVTRQAVFAAIQRGDLPAKKIGTAWVIAAGDCDAYNPALTQADKGKRSAGKPKTKQRKEQDN